MSNNKGSEKIDLNSLTKKSLVQDLGSFEAYLRDVWSDLYSRVNKNKNDSKEKPAVKLKGLSKIIFNSYYNLPGIIGERLFKVFDTNSSESIELNEFVDRMKTLFYEEYEKNTKFIFDFYDFDNDGKINKEDIRVVLSYITLNYSDNNSKIKSIDKTGITIKHRQMGQEELNDILNKCFSDKHIKNQEMDYEDFRHITENLNSDIYLMIYLFLLENRPFSNKNLESYQNHQSPRRESPNKKEKLLIASPTKNANFSPYKRFRRQSCSINNEKNSKDILKKMKLSPSKSPRKPDKDGEIRIPQKKNTSKTLKGLKELSEFSELSELQSLGDDDRMIESIFKNHKYNDELDLKRVDQLITVKKKKEIRESESPIRPVFKQSSKFGTNMRKKDRKKNENNIQIIDDEDDNKNEEDDDDEEDSDSSDDSSYEDDEENNQNKGINYQGKLYYINLIMINSKNFGLN